MTLMQELGVHSPCWVVPLSFSGRVKLQGHHRETITDSNKMDIETVGMLDSLAATFLQILTQVHAPQMHAAGLFNFMSITFHQYTSRKTSRL